MALTGICLADQPKRCTKSILCETITANLRAPAVVMTVLPGAATEDASTVSTIAIQSAPTGSPDTPSGKWATSIAVPSSANPADGESSATSRADTTQSQRPDTFEGSAASLATLHWQLAVPFIVATGFIMS
ncbi:hypothetical protein CC79DRAFT_1370560 [Sarocladium strictum]